MDEVVFSPGLLVLAPGLVMLALNVAAATIFVGTTTFVVERLSRRASLQVRHAILCVSLLFTLASPVLVWLASQFSLGCLPILVVDADSGEEESEPGDRSFDFEIEPAQSTNAAPTSPVADQPALTTASTPIDDPASIDNPATNTVDLGLDSFSSPVNRSRTAKILSAGVKLFLFCWGIVALWFAARLAYGLIVVRRLRRSLRKPTDARICEVAEAVFAKSGTGQPLRLAESPIAPAPLTLGWWRPVIVVPTGLASILDDEQLASILAHELAHVRRRDTSIGLMQQLVSAIFWWNPFLALINRQIGRLRERMCDDFAVNNRGNTAALAQALVRVAEWSAARSIPSPLTSGLLEDAHELEERIFRLTETDRPIATRLTRPAVAGLGAFALFLGSMLLLPILRADEEGLLYGSLDLDFNVRERDLASETITDRIAGERSIRLAAPTVISISGHVRTSQGEPIAGATVYLLTQHGNGAHLRSEEPLAVTSSDAQGAYQFQRVAIPTIETGRSPFEPSGMFQVAAEKDGYGIGWLKSRFCFPMPRPNAPSIDDEACFQGEAVELNLTLRSESSLKGRIVDEQGRPVENVSIELSELNSLFADITPEMSPFCAFSLLHLMPERYHQALTDADGRFEIHGLPAESVARACLDHPDFACQSVNAAISAAAISHPRYVVSEISKLKEDGETQEAYSHWRSQPVSLSPLEVRLRSPRRILVDVVHEQDGTPARGVAVSAVGVKSRKISPSMAGGRTDEQGRVELRLPPGEYTVHLFPLRSSDDLQTSQTLIVEDQPAEQAIKLQLKKGCTLTLEVVDARTGKGIPQVSFLELSPTEGLKHHGFITNHDGECQAVVAPGTHRYSIQIAEGYPDLDPIGPKPGKEVVCEAGKTARLRFRLRK